MEPMFGQSLHLMSLFRRRRKATVYTEEPFSLYPVTIFPARYQGTYEGGRWLAFNLYFDQVPQQAHGDDVTCAGFFSYWDKPLGKGNSPQEAYEDLLRQVKG